MQSMAGTAAGARAAAPADPDAPESIGGASVAVPPSSIDEQIHAALLDYLRT